MVARSALPRAGSAGSTAGFGKRAQGKAGHSMHTSTRHGRAGQGTHSWAGWEEWQGRAPTCWCAVHEERHAQQLQRQMLQRRQRVEDCHEHAGVHAS